MMNGTIDYKRKSSIDLAAKIRETALKMGYRANVAARVMRTGKVDDIALILSTQSHLSILTEIALDGIFTALGKSGRHLIMAPVEDKDLTNPDYVPNILSEFRAGGVLINYNAKIPPRMVELVRSFNPPHIWLNSKHAANCVYPDDFAAGKQLVSRLLAMGLRKIAYADYFTSKNEPPLHYSATDRYEGYAAKMKSAGLAPCRVDDKTGLPHPPRDLESAVEATAKWLLSRDCPEAVVCYTAHTAKIIHHTLAATRLKKPAPVVAVFNDRGEWEFSDNSVTQIIPLGEMTRRGTELLLGQMNLPQGTDVPEIPPVKLKPGATAVGKNVAFRAR